MMGDLCTAAGAGHALRSGFEYAACCAPLVAAALLAGMAGLRARVTPSVPRRPLIRAT